MHRWIARSFMLAAVLFVVLPVVAGAQDDLVKRGAAIGGSPEVELAAALRSIAAYSDRTVRILTAITLPCTCRAEPQKTGRA